MLVHPQFDPIALKLGPLAIHWYGLMYVVAFMLFLWLGAVRTRQPQWAQGGWTRRDIEDLLFFGVIGVILGGRLGYVLFYKPGYYAGHPLEALMVWKGGMSFHGGLLGAIAATALYARRRGRRFLEVTDLIAPCVPTGLAAGRIGNFINGELWGRAADPSLPWAMVFPQSGSALARHPSQLYQALLEVTDLIAPCVPTGLAAGRIGNFINGELWGRAADPSLPWAMVFPQSGSALARHPSQLYQALLEGLLLFVLLWLYARKPRGSGQVSGAFLIGYGVLRFVAEFFREPDAFLGPLALGMTMGQWLCVPMVAAGVWLWTRGATLTNAKR